MNAVRLHSYGSRPILEAVPEPAVERPADVVVRVGGAGLCRTDLHIVQGHLREAMNVQLPYTLGHETAGWVEAVGSDVTHVRPGDAVIVHPLVTCGKCRACRGGDDMHCSSSVFPGLDANGGFAQLLRTGARAVMPIPAGLEPAVVAALSDAGLAAYHAAKKAVPALYPGTTAVVLGAGGLGHLGIQVLRTLTPARVIAVDESEEALRLALDCGADDAVPADGGQVDRVRELTEGAGAEVVLDCAGEGGAPGDALRMLRRGGTYLLVGYGGLLDVPAVQLVGAELSVVGNLVGTYNELEELMALAARGDVTVRTRTYPLDAVNDALDDLEQGRLHGRAILVPGG
jgi:NAD+-dependent secondary alcohol dehydrogenase Adh1